MAMDEAQGTLWESIECTACIEGDAPAAGSLDESVADAIRAAYFAEAGELAVRYGIGVNDLIEHLERAGLARSPRPERAIEHIRCAVHATALCLGVAQAWADLVTALGPGFDRACIGRLQSDDGIAFARRFWVDLRESTIGARAARRDPRSSARRPKGARVPDLRSFSATRPLRYWLAERLIGTLELELGRAASAAERLDTVEEVRTLRIPAQLAAGAETRHG